MGYDKDGSIGNKFTKRIQIRLSATMMPKFFIKVYVKKVGKFSFLDLSKKPKKVQEEFWKYFEQAIRSQEKDAQASGGKGIVDIYDFDGFVFEHFGSVAGSPILTCLMLTYFSI